MNDDIDDNDANGINDKNRTYKPDELPSEINRRLWVTYGIGKYNAGQIQIHDFDYKGYDDDREVTLCQTAIVIQIPPIDRDGLKSKALEALEAEKQNVLAENHRRLKAIQDKIDNLLAIEYKQSGAA